MMGADRRRHVIAVTCFVSSPLDLDLLLFRAPPASGDYARLVSIDDLGKWQAAASPETTPDYLNPTQVSIHPYDKTSQPPASVSQSSGKFVHLQRRVEALQLKLTIRKNSFTYGFLIDSVVIFVG